jgi:hypothetical protein
VEAILSYISQLQTQKYLKGRSCALMNSESFLVLLWWETGKGECWACPYMSCMTFHTPRRNLSTNAWALTRATLTLLSLDIDRCHIIDIHDFSCSPAHIYQGIIFMLVHIATNGNKLKQFSFAWILISSWSTEFNLVMKKFSHHEVNCFCVFLTPICDFSRLWFITINSMNLIIPKQYHPLKELY